MRLVCFGDSNTYGYDPRGFFGGRYSAEDRWPDLLAKRTGLEVINLGTNGAQIPSPCQRIPEQDHRSSADILLVMLGTNDLLQGTSVEKTAAQMEAFLRWVISHWGRVLLITPPPMQRGAWVTSDALIADSHRLAEEYCLLAHKLNIPCIDTRRWNIELAFDGVHFTEGGHHSFAKNLRKELCL